MSVFRAERAKVPATSDGACVRDECCAKGSISL